jgi:hypothetical protein
MKFLRPRASSVRHCPVSKACTSGSENREKGRRSPQSGLKQGPPLRQCQFVRFLTTLHSQMSGISRILKATYRLALTSVVIPSISCLLSDGLRVLYAQVGRTHDHGLVYLNYPLRVVAMRREGSRKHRTIGKCRRPSFRIGGRVKGCRHCFEAPPDSVDVITTLRQIMKICRELRIREDRLAGLPRLRRGPRCIQPPFGALTK